MGEALVVDKGFSLSAFIVFGGRLISPHQFSGQAVAQVFLSLQLCYLLLPPLQLLSLLVHHRLQLRQLLLMLLHLHLKLRRILSCLLPQLLFLLILPQAKDSGFFHIYIVCFIVHRGPRLLFLLVIPLGNRMGRMRRLLREPRNEVLPLKKSVFGSNFITRITRNCFRGCSGRHRFTTEGCGRTTREHFRLKW